MALLKTARFFLISDLDLRIEGDEEGDLETLNISLEIEGVIHLRKFLHFHSSESRLSSLKPFCSKKPTEFCFCLCTVIELIVVCR